MHGEKKDAHTSAAEHLIENTLPWLFESYDSENVYDADETGLYYCALPDGTLTFKSDTSGGSNKSKDCVTVLVACNMTGSDKHRLLVIRKSRDPRYFRGKNNFPFHTITVKMLG